MTTPQEDSKVAVIVGGGVAGTSCAIHLNALSPTTNIMLVDPRPSLKICNILTQLSHTVLETEITEADAEAWCKQRNMTFLRTRATSLCSNAIILEDGRKVSFDACCLASGARPFIPAALQETQFSNYVLTLRDTDSVQRLKKRLASARRVVVVGAGGIGMEVIHEITGCEVVWVVKSSHIGGLFFDEQIAAFIQKLQQDRLNQNYKNETNAGTNLNDSNNNPSNNSYPLKQNNGNSSDNTGPERKESSAAVGPDWLGQRDRAVFFDENGSQIISRLPSQVQGGRLKGPAKNDPKSAIQKSDTRFCNQTLQILTRCEVVRLTTDQSKTWPVVVELSNETSVGCDLIISGTGVTANIDWLDGSGIAVPNDLDAGGGIHVRAGKMQTNIAGIFAAGDCTLVKVESDTDWVQMRTWGQALTGGHAAATEMASYLADEQDLVTGLEFEMFAHSTHFFGSKVVLLGRWKAQGLDDGFKVLERQGAKTFVRVVLQNGRVRGAVLVGNVENAEVFENLILGRMDVEWMGEDLIDEDIELDHFFD